MKDPEDQFFGDRTASVNDVARHQCVRSDPNEDCRAGERKRRAAAMFKQKAA